MLFDLPPILGLAPLILYIILAFKKNMHPIVNVAVCVLFGAILTKQSLGSLGAVIYESMGSSWPWLVSSSCWVLAWVWCCARLVSLRTSYRS